MNKRNLLVMVLAGLVSISIAARPAAAGNVQRNRWEGVAIGVGAAVLGGILWNHYRHDRHDVHVTYHRRPPHSSPKRYHPKRPVGHWEVRKIWASPKYKTVWNPGHYNRRGRWVPGEWINIEKRPGYWKEARIWVAETGHHPYYR